MLGNYKNWKLLPFPVCFEIFQSKQWLIVDLPLLDYTFKYLGLKGLLY